MPNRAIRLVRRSVTVCWLAMVALLLTLVAGLQIATFTGRTPLIVRGGSMAPALPIGSLAVVDAVDPMSVAPGDVISFRVANGVVVTHRVTRVVGGAADRRFETRGDANQQPDPTLISATDLVGRVDFSVPVAGYLAAMLGTTSGLVSFLSLITSLVFLGWLLDDLLSGQPDEHPSAGEVRVRAGPT